ncbi:MATE family efflux transporter [Anaeromyxobacter dehalogenans]|uniref:Multidrug-efflux transporter n=1 Tax=Anaeromyxobacter dehalogenans (strain 2CP-C) TaxID=290397 RepID=Q2IPI9_ANADE|nr:MATE family efflux transporter [Anaeromyxobacter dehalogenans]ABC80723.1 MATE efflux family protein [Anaeromyxobacter dehalogenans 2CP-C]
MSPAAPPLRAELRALLRLALPLSLAHGGQALMGVVDAAIVGRAGAVPLAGTGLGASLFFAVAVLGMGIMHGLDPLISQAIGAGDERRARHLLWQAAWLAALLAAAFTLPIALIPAALVPLGISADVAAQAGPYIWWRLPGLFFFLYYFGARAYLQAHGRGRPMVVATVGANLLNVPADLLLVFGGASLPAWTGPLRLVPALGAAGAAIATSLCIALQAFVLVRATRAVSLGGPRPGGLARPDRAALATAVRVGGPVGLHMFAEVGFFSLVSFLAGRLGAEALGAHQIALAVASLTFTMAVGLGDAGSVRVGLAVGAHDRAGARRAGLCAFAGGASIMLVPALAFTFAPGVIGRIMTDDPGVLALAVPLLRVAAIFQLSDGLQAVGAGVLRGAGETRFTFLANLAGHWLIGLPATLLLGFTMGHGVVGLWGGFCFGLTAVAVALLGRFLRVSSRGIVPLAERAAA